MLKGLRFRLTLLYLLVGMLLVGIIGMGSYSLLNYFFQSSNDIALKCKMSLTFRVAGETPPQELVVAEQAWLSQSQNPFLSFINHNEDTEMEDHEEGGVQGYVEEAYEGELASIFVLPLDTNGRLLFNPNPYPVHMDPDQDAVQHALQNGWDLRNGKLDDGSPVRLLTYTFPSGSGYDLIQMGKPIADQSRVMHQFLGGLLLIGVLSVVLLGVGSWWMAGNSLQPMQAAWDHQQQFIANASHELRTPLTLIRASTELALRHSDAGSRQEQLLSDVIQDCDHMTSLVEDMLLLSRLDAQQLKMNLSDVDVKSVLDGLQRQLEPVMQEKAVQWEVDAAASTILADETRLRQVILILLDNAMRHTPQGGTIRLKSQIEGQQVQISVSDTGEGIPSRSLTHVFERFYQVEDARGGQGGSGLGLSIAKALIEAQYGSIVLESKAGQGTQIFMRFPVIQQME